MNNHFNSFVAIIDIQQIEKPNHVGFRLVLRDHKDEVFTKEIFILRNILPENIRSSVYLKLVSSQNNKVISKFITTNEAYYNSDYDDDDEIYHEHKLDEMKNKLVGKVIMNYYISTPRQKKLQNSSYELEYILKDNLSNNY